MLKYLGVNCPDGRNLSSNGSSETTHTVRQVGRADVNLTEGCGVLCVLLLQLFCWLGIKARVLRLC